MGLAQDLLRLAHHLATYSGDDATQSDYRRAISTAYYAIFHLLTEDCGRRWRGGSTACEIGLQRALDHGSMRAVSSQFQIAGWTDWTGSYRLAPSALRRFAATFVYLQQRRHAAGYDNSRIWPIGEVLEVLNAGEYAVHDWESIRDEPIAGDYATLLENIKSQATAFGS